ncbi:MAG: nucleotidyltransferase family protein [Clostridia bacterium]|nr:nucleotidyltransferase family protein [Clostridia bacterium]
MNSEEAILYLCKCAVRAQTAQRDRIADVDPDEVFALAQKHMLAALVGAALEDAGISTPKFKQAIAMAKRKAVVLAGETAAVCGKLDQAGIWYLPLKGAVLKDWYPKFGMRESADVDILFDPARAADVREIMIGLGYTVQSFGHGHHDVYYKAPLTNMQMHVALFGPGYPAALNDFFADVKPRLVPQGGCAYAFTPEDFYLDVTAHAWDHFEKAGTGLRSVLDTFVMLQKLELDWQAIRAASEKLGIRAFEEQNRSLATHLFGDGALTAADRALLASILGAGAHGTLENVVKNKVTRFGGGKKGKARYLLRRLFLPMQEIEYQYPFFFRHKLLIPFLPAYRLFRGWKRHRKRLLAEWNVIGRS